MIGEDTLIDENIIECRNCGYAIDTNNNEVYYRGNERVVKLYKCKRCHYCTHHTE